MEKVNVYSIQYRNLLEYNYVEDWEEDQVGDNNHSSDLRDRMCRQEVREISTGSSPIVSFGISSVEPSGSDIKEFI
jgi:hypothetical protein